MDQLSSPDHASDVSAVDVNRVSKIFVGEQEVRALDDVSVAIRRNEFFTLLGPSGCGKTTLLRLIAGFEPPTMGTLQLAGRDISRLPPNQRPINTVFQNYALFPHMSVAGNIAFGLEMLGKPKAEITETVDRMLKLVQMEALKSRRTSEISGGQQQRVALARALAPHPEVLLLDEPLSALDLKLRKEMQIELKRLQHETGITFVFVTHDQEEALTMSDRIVVMNNGRVEQDGTPEELYFHPTTRFVAEFIGETNLLTGEMRGQDGDSVMMNWFGQTLRGHAPGGAPRVGDAVTASVRLEKLDFHTTRPDATNAVQGTVVGKTFLGSRMTLDLVIKEAQGAKLRAFVDAEMGQSVGSDPIWIGWDSDSMSVLQD